jgi:hypothetical protein
MMDVVKYKMRTGEFVGMKVMSHAEFKSMEKQPSFRYQEFQKDLVSTKKLKDMSELSIVHVFILIDLEFCSYLLGFIRNEKRITSK